MTIYRYLLDEMVNNGLLDEQARSVLSAMMIAPDLDAMVGRWGDDVSGYPAYMITGLSLAADTHAAKWLDEHAPGHFARGLFPARVTT